ncbi:MAG: GMC family oxidoreductase [Pseudomonadota bacterium]
MIVDLQSYDCDQLPEFDVAIAGAGVAGLTLAAHLDGCGLRVAVLESGLLDADSGIQSLYRGENVGLPYYPLETARSRQFGGSSNRWLLEIGDDRTGARLFPMDPLDFETREWVANSGWPFGFSEIHPYYEKASEFLDLASRGFEARAWVSGDQIGGLPFTDGDVYSKVYQCVGQEFFGDHCRNLMQDSENITVFLNANLTRINVSSAGDCVTGFSVTTFQGKEFRVLSKEYVLATGAIASASVLLASRMPDGTAVGNQNDLVGRYFMEHPHLWNGVYIPSNHRLMAHQGFYSLHKHPNSTPIVGQISLSQETQRQHQLLNHSIVLNAARKPQKALKPHSVSGGVQSLRESARAFLRGDLEAASRHASTLVPVAGTMSVKLYRRTMKITRRFIDLRRKKVFRLNHMAEQVPNPNSRVTLGESTDKFGVPVAKLDWQITKQEIASLRATMDFIKQKLESQGLGTIQYDLRSNEPPADLHGGWHHMGTTRMSNSERSGVTDANGNVHGISNFMVAGPSNFPTSGSANPTYTIVALAIRASEHLRKKLS